ncbi:MAG: hypothetical protein PCFJNLEI_01395 [Verrucomicrobiae bacterium]|nr:hypothetical protein [Verrucomicrobiae bacterium]
MASVNPKRCSQVRSAAQITVLVSLLIQAGASVARANNIWDGGDPDDNNWTSAANWGADTPPTLGLEINFAGSTRLNPTNDYAAGTSIGSILFSSTAGAFVLDGNAITQNSFIRFSANPSSIITQTVNLNISTSSGINPRTQVNGTIVLNGMISGAGGVKKDSADGLLVMTGLNTFAGLVDVQRGTLAVNSIANAGVASALGTGANSPAIKLGNGNLTGTLRYTGSANASTDRQIILGSAGAFTGSGIIENNGAGTWSFTNPNFNVDPGAASARILTLQGTNTSDNLIAGAITNGTSTLGLTKAGTGKWVLSGTNSYTGLTTINAGTLIVDGDQIAATGVVTVNSNATLGGNGIIGGNTTIKTNATISPGTGSGTLTFNAALTLSNYSTYVYEARDLVDVNGTLTLPTGAWRVDLNGPGLQSGGSLVLFTFDSLAGIFNTNPTFSYTGFTVEGEPYLSVLGDSVVLNGVSIVSVVPEPSILCLVAVGGLLLWRVRRRRTLR